MIKDPSRGWAWTRALLGLRAEEIHLCGETGGAELIQELCLTTGEDVEVRKYKRLTPLSIEDSALSKVPAWRCVFSSYQLLATFQTIWEMFRLGIALCALVRTIFIMCRGKLRLRGKRLL